MTKSSTRKSRAKAESAKARVNSRTGLLCPDNYSEGKRTDLLIALVLLAFGAYQSINYFGHLAVPNPDFTGFIKSARQFWQGGFPHYYKRAPVLGFLQIPLGWIVGGPHPDLTGGWLLNGILHPFNILLMWLVGRRIVGRSAIWVAIVAMLNPWVIYLITEPLCETTLMFFMLLTFYLMFKRSNLCYVFASITTMVRYEGAALIMAAFFLDMIYRKSKGEKIKAFVYSVIACVPLGLWLLGTVMHWEQQGSGNYIRLLNPEHFSLTLSILRSLWQVAILPLMMPQPGAFKSSVERMQSISQFVVVMLFLAGLVTGWIKRKLEVLAIMIFFVPYMIIHIIYEFTTPRFYETVHWMLLFIVVLGLQGIWELINKGKRIPKPAIIAAQAVLLVAVCLYYGRLFEFLPSIKQFIRASAPLPYVLMLVLAVLYGVFRWRRKYVFAWHDAVISIVVLAMIVSNQYMLIKVVGNGQSNLEFKQLAQWYRENAKEGEKLLCTLSNVVAIFAPEDSRYFIHPAGIKADNPKEFILQCYEKGVVYVVWDSRIGMQPQDINYKRWGIRNFAFLAKPRSIGLYEYLTTIYNEHVRGRYVNVFKLNKPPAAPGN